MPSVRCSREPCANRTQHPSGSCHYHRSLASLPVGTDPSLVPVLTTSCLGVTSRLTPGVLDDNAEFVFKNGQCVALAVELARRLELPTISALVDSDGAVTHAFLTLDGDTVLDVRGRQDREAFLESYGYRYEDDFEGGAELEEFYLESYDDGSGYPPPDSVDWLLDNCYLQEQDMETARTFVSAVLNSEESVA